MSDNLSFILIVTEGPHDVGAISRVLGLKGFHELQKDDEVPSELSRMIPRQYPSRMDHRLIHLVPHPTFFERNGQYMTVSNAGGKDRLGENLLNLIGVLSAEALAELRCIVIIADMDESSAEKRKEEIIKQIQSKEPEALTEMNNLMEGNLSISDYRFSFRLFLLPDNNAQGTLEALLLEGAGQQYPDLLKGASTYINSAKKNYSEELRGFNDQKATVGAIANVLRPGRANQVSIAHDNWFTSESLQNTPLHIKFEAFIESLCTLFENERPENGV